MEKYSFSRLCLLFLLSGFVGQASAASSVQIISANQLRLKLAQVSVIDAREEGFEKGHIPGSQSVDWKDWTLKKPNLINYVLGTTKDWGRVPLPNAELKKRLEALGLSNEQEIVVVGKPKSWGEEGRMAWLFLYFGAKRVSLLNGGIDAWAKANYPLETGKSVLRVPGHFKFEIDSKRLASLSEVEQAVKDSKRPLFDARTLEEFQGKRLTAQKRGGHLPGARLLPVLELYEANGNYIERERLSQLVKLQGGVPIAYCTGGVRSALLALLIEARLGVVSSNYDASIWEWSDDPSKPLVGQSP